MLIFWKLIHVCIQCYYSKCNVLLCNKKYQPHIIVSYIVLTSYNNMVYHSCDIIGDVSVTDWFVKKEIRKKKSEDFQSNWQVRTDCPTSLYLNLIMLRWADMASFSLFFYIFTVLDLNNINEVHLHALYWLEKNVS